MAAKWIQQAAQQGEITAQYALGRFYEDGTGITQSVQQATEWYTKAAEQGNVRAQLTLGRLYEQGRGCGKRLNSGSPLVCKGCSTRGCCCSI
ncbi:MAG: tetratricopeptide repeat protein [Candidatus Symbiodolus clandestinus]